MFEDMKENEVSTTMSWSQALEALKAGECVSRTDWNGKGMFIFLVQGSTFVVNRPPLLGIFPEGTEIKYLPHIDMYNAQGQVVPWLASQGDQMSDQWIIVGKPSEAKAAA